MRLAVPFFKQESPHTCGRAVLRMVSAFLGNEKTRDEVTAVLPMDPEHGTKNADMVAGAERLGFSTTVRENASVDDIRGFVGGGVPVIVNFLEPGVDEGHYSLVVGFDDEAGTIVFNDPEHGEGFSLPVADFESRWRSGFEDHERWLMVIENTP